MSRSGNTEFVRASNRFLFPLGKAVFGASSKPRWRRRRLSLSRLSRSEPSWGRAGRPTAGGWTTATDSSIRFAFRELLDDVRGFIAHSDDHKRVSMTFLEITQMRHARHAETEDSLYCGSHGHVPCRDEGCRVEPSGLYLKGCRQRRMPYPAPANCVCREKTGGCRVFV